MARTVLPTNFQDDVLNDSMGGKRRYRMITNADNTVSFEDATVYDTEGSVFGASRVNEIAMNVNESADVSEVGDVTDLPYPTETICQNVSALGGFRFYVEGSVDLVALVEDDSFYTDEDGYYILADSPTGQEMIDDETYKALPNEEKIYSWGADTGLPFNGGSVIPKELLSYTIPITGSTSCSAYIDGGEGQARGGSFSCRTNNILTNKTPDGHRAFLFKIEVSVSASASNSVGNDSADSSANYILKTTEGTIVSNHTVSARATSSTPSSSQTYNIPADMITNFVTSKYVYIEASGSASAYAGWDGHHYGVNQSSASFGTVKAHYVVFK